MGYLKVGNTLREIMDGGVYWDHKITDIVDMGLNFCLGHHITQIRSDEGFYVGLRDRELEVLDRTGKIHCYYISYEIKEV